MICTYPEKQVSRIELIFFPKPVTGWDFTVSSTSIHSYINQIYICRVAATLDSDNVIIDTE